MPNKVSNAAKAALATFLSRVSGAFAEAAGSGVLVGDEMSRRTGSKERESPEMEQLRAEREDLERRIAICEAGEKALKRERDALEASMEERAKALRASEQRFKDFALSSGERFWEVDADHRFTWLDEPGRPDRMPLINAILGKTRWEVGGADIENDPFWRAHHQTIMARKPFRDFEYETGKALGEPAWWSVSGRPIYSETGEFIGYRGVGANVTERKRDQFALEQKSRDLEEANAALAASLAQRDTLLTELQHRVKNSLQVVVSLLNLRAGQAPGADTKDAILEASQRVEALSLAHRFLYHPERPSQTVLSEYIPALCKMLSQAYDIGAARIEVAIDVEPASIPLAKITPVALLLNELISNAFKHAFPGERGGKISVQLQAETAEGGERFLRIQVADDGVGLPDEVELETTRSMGLTVFRGLVGQIDGEVTVDRRDGTAITVRFPQGEENGL